MSADDDLNCAPAPAPATPTESSAKTEYVRTRGGTTTTFAVGLLAVFNTVTILSKRKKPNDG